MVREDNEICIIDQQPFGLFTSNILSHSPNELLFAVIKVDYISKFIFNCSLLPILLIENK